MATIKFSHKGDFSKTSKFFARSEAFNRNTNLDKYGEAGVRALEEATPKDTGLTSRSWSYKVVRERGKLSIYWLNSNEQKSVNIAVILQYGHGTKNGGYVKGRDYINPAIRPVFDDIADAAWKEVTKD